LLTGLQSLRSSANQFYVIRAQSFKRRQQGNGFLSGVAWRVCMQAIVMQFLASP
jgi:hypothetical protein